MTLLSGQLQTLTLGLALLHPGSPGQGESSQCFMCRIFLSLDLPYASSQIRSYLAISSCDRDAGTGVVAVMPGQPQAQPSRLLGPSPQGLELSLSLLVGSLWQQPRAPVTLVGNRRLGTCWVPDRSCLKLVSPALQWLLCPTQLHSHPRHSAPLILGDTQ